jgi:hypothetical protein
MRLGELTTGETMNTQVNTPVSVRLIRCRKPATLRPMTELMRLIQGHLDRYGVTRAEFARRAGTTPQTVQNWKDRPTTLPRREHLEGVARVLGVPYAVVLNAALSDAGYRDSDEVTDLADAARTQNRPKPKPE